VTSNCSKNVGEKTNMNLRQKVNRIPTIQIFFGKDG
jgi:hypothetical protein